MIDFIDVSKQYGPQDVLKQAGFRIHPGERAGIVGPNGAGKSTLFRLISGEEQPDKGDVITPRQARMGYLRQVLAATEQNCSLLDFTLRARPELERMHEEMAALEKALPQTDAGEKKRMLDRLGRLQSEYEHSGGYEIETRARAGLSGLGFDVHAFDRPLRSFSGGWQMRAELARVLIGQPDILLLDEPSNYLDLPAVEWLQRQMRSFEGTLLLISHDRYLLDQLTRVTIEVAAGRTTRYEGNYSRYVVEREARREALEAAKRNQDKKVEQIERFVDRFRAKASKATQVQSRVRMLDKIDRIDMPEEAAALSLIRLPAPPHSGHRMITMTGVGHSYDGSRWVLRGVNLELERGDRMAVVGYNGMGKSTLLKIMAGHVQAAEGTRTLGHQVVVGYQSQEFKDTMPENRSAYEIVRAASKDAGEREVRDLLGGFGFSGEWIDKPCGILSGGEKIRLAFARLFINPPNLLLLDEPTTHLDIQGREALQKALENYAGTVCLVSHDLHFVRSVATSILSMGPPIARYPGGYDYYLEKTGGPAAQQAAAAAITENSTVTPTPAGSIRRDQKKLARAIERTMADLEKRIGALDAERKEWMARLSEIAPGLDFATVNARLSTLQHEEEQLTLQWEQEATRLEELS